MGLLGIFFARTITGPVRQLVAGAEGVTIDSITGDFGGYAWGENLGWINSNSSGPVSYKVSLLPYRIYLPLVTKGS